MNVGILGGGQLARMLALAGHPLGLSFLVVDPSAQACAAAVTTHICANYDDPAALSRLARETDVVTYEFENVAASTLEQLGATRPIRPPLRALLTARDRANEKRLFSELGIATARYQLIEREADLAEALRQCGLPALLKTRTEGYDGKGQVLIQTATAALAAWERLGRRPAIIEQVIGFQREVSVIAVRGADGEIRYYPLAENTHREGILRVSRSRPDDPMQAVAREYARKLLIELDYVGVLALELFEVDGALLANEFAPRVHNSGHWTIEGAATSQFENHLRAVAGLPLGDTHATGPTALVNLIAQTPEPASVLRHPGCHLHVYGKAPRPGRKLGHITVTAPDEAQLQDRLDRLRGLPGVCPQL